MTRTITLLFVLGIFAAACDANQAKDMGSETSRSDNKGAEKEVLLVQARRFRAMNENDVSALESILSDDLTYTHTTGTTETKAEFLSSLQAQGIAYHSIEPTDVKVRISGNTAVVTGISAMKVSAGEQHFEFSIRFIEVYENNEESWRLVAWQSTRLREQ